MTIKLDITEGVNIHYAEMFLGVPVHLDKNLPFGYYITVSQGIWDELQQQKKDALERTEE